MTQKVYEDDGFLVIEGSKGNSTLNYDLAIWTLDKVQKFKDPKSGETKNYSRTISDLINKKWIEKESLYKVAQITDKNFKTHKINWTQTFKMVERLFYYKAIDNHEKGKKPKHEGTARDLHDEMMAAFDRAGEEDKNKDVQNSLNKAVADNLAKYNLREIKQTFNSKVGLDSNYIDILYSVTGTKYTFAQASYRRWGPKGKIVNGVFYQLMPEHAADPFFYWYCEERAEYQFFKSKANCVIYFLKYWFLWTKNK